MTIPRPTTESTDTRGAFSMLGYIAQRLGKALSRATEVVVADHGLTNAEYLTLLVVSDGGVSNAELARRTFVTPQAANLVLHGLLARDYVTRAPHASDKRLLLISLTAEGRRVLDGCQEGVIAVEERIYEQLSPGQREMFFPALAHAAEVLAGGYFGDLEAEAAAAARRIRTR